MNTVGPYSLTRAKNTEWLYAQLIDQVTSSGDAPQSFSALSGLVALDLLKDNPGIIIDELEKIRTDQLFLRDPRRVLGECTLAAEVLAPVISPV